MTWVKLDDTCPDHPKIVGLSDAGFACWIRSLCYASRHLTDGYVPRAALRAMGTPKAARELVAAGLWLEVEGGWQIHDYTEHQRTAEEVAELKPKKARAGSKGNHQRWHVDRGIVDPECRHCIAACDSGAIGCESQTDRKRSPDTEADTDTDLYFQPPPTHVGTRPEPGGGDVIDQAARRLAEAEVARRGAEIGNPSGYVRARIAPLRREHEPTWRRLLERDPAMTAEQLVAALNDPPAAQAVGEARPLPPVFRAPEHTAPTIDMGVVRALRERLPSHRRTEEHA